MAETNISHVAVFWDIENVTPSSGDTLFIQGLWDYAEGLGRVVASYAYADWSKPGFKSLGPNLSSLHFYMVHVPFRRRRANKNGSDMQLVSDAMDLMRFYDHVDTYILITGDSDFRPLLLNMRRQGKKIYIVCDIKTASQDLLILADNFTDYRDLIPDASSDDDDDEDEDDTPAASGRGRVDTASYSREYWYERLAETAAILHKEKNATNPGTVKIKMKMLNKGFDEKKLGFKRWSSFISAAVKAGFVEIDEQEKQTDILPGSHYKQDGGSLQVALRTLDETLRELDGGKSAQFQKYSIVSPILKDKGINMRQLGFGQFKKFVASAEARGLVETKVERLTNYVKRAG